MPHIWVVDDEDYICDLIRRYLEKEGYKVRTFGSAEAVENALLSDTPALFILDIMLPGSDGLNLCRKIRENISVPIIFVSARGEEFDRVLGLELGADDYLAKPFSPRELVLRVKTIFRRMEQPKKGKDHIVLKNAALYPDQRRVLINREEIAFTPREYELFAYLAAAPGRAFSRQLLLEKLWGYDYEGDERAVDDTVKRIRKKLREKGALAELATVWGYGYKLNV